MVRIKQTRYHYFNYLGWRVIFNPPQPSTTLHTVRLLIYKLTPNDAIILITKPIQLSPDGLSISWGD